MKKCGPFEQVYVENEWYDGPRAGVADIHGAPHRFKSLFDEDDDAYLGTFLVWPVDAISLAFEIEQWCIFVAWNSQFEARAVATDTHPGHGGINPRWDALEALLRNSRSEIPANARTATAEMARIERGTRYAAEGPDYRLAWHLLE
jgi:hypothetical protein